ncbi:MAG: hypothetical protein K9L98_00415 [Candidatus Pacebacteria bacterium]|nr:hypothetical protein [Candidatus Paceibacterota bacterium]MCF7862461.1 hypothetical protein [Candidatus Paceibacterota bacterium]
MTGQEGLPIKIKVPEANLPNVEGLKAEGLSKPKLDVPGIIQANDAKIAELGAVAKTTGEKIEGLRAQLGLDPNSNPNLEVPPSIAYIQEKRRELEEKNKKLLAGSPNQQGVEQGVAEQGITEAGQAGEKGMGEVPAGKPREDLPENPENSENAQKPEAPEEAPKQEPSQDQEKNKNPEEKEDEISKEVIERLSAVMQAKKALEARVAGLKDSPAFKAFEAKNKDLDEKRKKLEGLKNTINNGGGGSGGGVTSLEGSISFSGAVDSTSGQEDLQNGEASPEKSAVDLEQEVENLIKRTELEVLKLEKEEMEFGEDGLQIKAKEMDLEEKAIETETEIWSAGGMNQETFNKTLQNINNSEFDQSTIKNRDTFVRFMLAENEMESFKQENNDYYQSLEVKQTEIESKESELEGVEYPNENKIIGILAEHAIEKEEGEEGPKNLDGEKIAETAGAEKPPSDNGIETSDPAQNMDIPIVAGGEKNPGEVYK